MEVQQGQSYTAPVLALTAAAGSTAAGRLEEANEEAGRIIIALGGTGQAQGAIATLTFGEAMGDIMPQLTLGGNLAYAGTIEAAMTSATVLTIYASAALPAAGTLTIDYFLLRAGS